MAKITTVIRSDDFQSVGVAFLQVMALEVDVALRSAGIADVVIRRKVIDSFCFGMGNFFDQYWFDVDGKKYRPLLSYAKEIDAESPISAGMPDSAGFDYHDYAHGMFDAMTSNGDGTYQVPIGLIGRSEAMDPKDF